MNAVYVETRTRSFIRLDAITLAFKMAAIVMLVLLALAATALAFIYCYGPNRAKPNGTRTARPLSTKRAGRSFLRPAPHRFASVCFIDRGVRRWRVRS
jgi:hypothetical protein